MDFSFSLSDDLYVISKGGRSVVEEEEEDSDVIFVIVFAVVAWIGTRVERPRPRRLGEISRSPFPPASSFWHAAEIEHEMSVN